MIMKGFFAAHKHFLKAAHTHRNNLYWDVKKKKK